MKIEQYIEFTGLLPSSDHVREVMKNADMFVFPTMGEGLPRGIPFNQGLNTIIGGRSSGKSILLSCLARLCGDRKPIKQNKAQYDEYIDAVSESMKLYWRDFGEETNRKIDFFPQSYIIDMASDPSKITELVENIMRDENGENKELTALKGKLEINKVFIHQLFSEYRKKIDELKRLHSDIKTIGNRDGILQEIQKLEDAIIDIKMAIKDGLSDEEAEVYVKQNERITTLKQKEYVCLQSIEELEQLSDRSLFTDIDLSFSLIQDDILRSKISSMYSSLKEETLEKWKGIIQSLEGEYKDKITESKKEISCRFFTHVILDRETS